VGFAFPAALRSDEVRMRNRSVSSPARDLLLLLMSRHKTHDAKLCTSIPSLIPSHYLEQFCLITIYQRGPRGLINSGATSSKENSAKDPNHVYRPLQPDPFPQSGAKFPGFIYRMPSHTRGTLRSRMWRATMVWGATTIDNTQIEDLPPSPCSWSSCSHD
jgi:hypothetical protein